MRLLTYYYQQCTVELFLEYFFIAELFHASRADQNCLYEVVFSGTITILLEGNLFDKNLQIPHCTTLKIVISLLQFKRRNCHKLGDMATGLFLNEARRGCMLCFRSIQKVFLSKLSRLYHDYWQQVVHITYKYWLRTIRKRLRVVCLARVLSSNLGPVMIERCIFFWVY